MIRSCRLTGHCDFKGKFPVVEARTKLGNGFRVARLKGLVPGRLAIKGEPFGQRDNLWEHSIVREQAVFVLFCF